jgi:cysteine synthase
MRPPYPAASSDAHDARPALAEARALARISCYARVPVVDLGAVEGTRCHILAICGGAHIDASFKNLLAAGMLLLLRREGALKPGQTVVESTSGSFGEGLAVAGQLLGHPIVLVSDPNLPRITRRKIELLGATLEFASAPHPTLGWQQSREDRVRAMIEDQPSWFWTDQNNSDVNPRVYSTWLVPEIDRQVDVADIAAGVFGVGSGGHFSALAAWLKQRNPRIRTYAADRIGSITFGGAPASSRIRGVGNQNIVPGVIERRKGLIDGVEFIDDDSAFAAVRELARHGVFVGGSSGLVFAAAVRIARRIGSGHVLTLFPDRGELYADTIWDDHWLRGSQGWRQDAAETRP